MGSPAQIQSLEVAGSSAGFHHDAGQQSRPFEGSPNNLSSDSNWCLTQFGFGVFLQTLPSSLTVELWGGRGFYLIVVMESLSFIIIGAFRDN